MREPVDVPDPGDAVLKPIVPTRRRLVGAALLGAVAGRTPARAGLAEVPLAISAGLARDDHGRLVRPISVPPIPLTLADGAVTTLAALVQGRMTALQLMFPTCTSTCPIGAAIFAEVQDLLPPATRGDILLVSIDISPWINDPVALTSWLDRFGARPGWTAASPGRDGLRDIKVLFDQGRDFNDDHSTRVQIIDRQGRLVWRTYELPSAPDVVSLLTSGA